MTTPATPSKRLRCVLVSHRVVKGPLERDHDLMWSEFVDLLDRLEAAGSTFAANLDAEPVDGAVVLTFDDFSTDHAAVADELTRRGIPGVFFPTVGAMGTPGHLPRSHVREVAAAGHVIGAHGWSHQRLDRLSDAELHEEIVTSKTTLEDLLGTAVTLFAPAGGIGFKALPERLAAAGYVVSRSTRWGIHRRMDDRWEIPAVPVTHTTSSRGWPYAAATEGRLPLTMSTLSMVRNTISPDVRTTIRGRLLGRAGDAPSRRDRRARREPDDADLRADVRGTTATPRPSHSKTPGDHWQADRSPGVSMSCLSRRRSPGRADQQGPLPLNTMSGPPLSMNSWRWVTFARQLSSTRWPSPAIPMNVRRLEASFLRARTRSGFVLRDRA